MVSVVVVGPSMSGKTTLCRQLLGMDCMQPHHATLSCYYLTASVNGCEWHVWDTPALETAADIDKGWPGEEVLAEADVVLVCHDGRYVDPMALVEACGTSRCIVVLTKSERSGLDMSYFLHYLQCCQDNLLQLVPRVQDTTQLIALICIKVYYGG